MFHFFTTCRLKKTCSLFFFPFWNISLYMVTFWQSMNKFIIFGFKLPYHLKVNSNIVLRNFDQYNFLHFEKLLKTSLISDNFIWRHPGYWQENRNLHTNNAFKIDNHPFQWRYFFHGEFSLLFVITHYFLEWLIAGYILIHYRYF